MPGKTFPFYMSPDHPLGLIFDHYDYGSTFDNDDIQQLLTGAWHAIGNALAANPSLANEPCHGWDYEHNPQGKGEDYYQLFLHPAMPEMKYSDIPTIIGVLWDWAMEWRAVETDFEIWARSGTGEQRKLGFGNLLFII